MNGVHKHAFPHAHKDKREIQAGFLKPLDIYVVLITFSYLRDAHCPFLALQRHLRSLFNFPDSRACTIRTYPPSRICSSNIDCGSAGAVKRTRVVVVTRMIGGWFCFASVAYCILLVLACFSFVSVSSSLSTTA